MSKGDYFVILTTPNGGCTPLMKGSDVPEEDDEFATFDSEQEAKEAAESSVLGEVYGYEVFERGCGC